MKGKIQVYILSRHSHRLKVCQLVWVSVELSTMFHEIWNKISISSYRWTFYILVRWCANYDKCDRAVGAIYQTQSSIYGQMARWRWWWLFIQFQMIMLVMMLLFTTSTTLLESFSESMIWFLWLPEPLGYPCQSYKIQPQIPLLIKFPFRLFSSYPFIYNSL